ncbi:MAG: M14 family metallocarboxypeptidase [Oscillospiraceae bacterium]|nr:M14 family metallocarboxypeptidase [Oscillospiraceae bacterium]
MTKIFNLEKMDEDNRSGFLNLLKKHSFVEHKILSKSLCGRSIDCVKIGKGLNNCVLFVGATHGMEWITSSLLFHFLEDICRIIEDKERIMGVTLNSFFTKNCIYVIPCLNPDGVEIQINGFESAGKYSSLISSLVENTNIWQSNARGVDINHNFDVNWKNLHKLEQQEKITGPSSTRYGGEFPFSEPESKVIKNICLNTNFRHVVSFHSQGEEIFWDYGENTPKRSKYMANMFHLYSGYQISKPEGLAVGGGLKDWFIDKFKKPGFTIEIGWGKNPLPIFDLPKIYKDLFKSMVLFTIL